MEKKRFRELPMPSQIRLMRTVYRDQFLAAVSKAALEYCTEHQMKGEDLQAQANEEFRKMCDHLHGKPGVVAVLAAIELMMDVSSAMGSFQNPEMN